MLLTDLGARIRAQRERLGLKQADIANALQVSPQAVSKWERGENGPDIAILGALARLLGVTTDWLLDTHREERDVFDATVFVSSVNGAYEKSLNMAPKEFALWATGLFTQLTDAVLSHDGVPVKYLGDAFLCFFAGPDHAARACRAAFMARRMVAEPLDIALSTGKVYLGAVGHRDYARPDVMGQVVNIAFLAMGWADEQDVASGIVATAPAVEAAGDVVAKGPGVSVSFKGLPYKVLIHELTDEN
jgi:transcriptional regulator with XRE-family HTH domain